MKRLFANFAPYPALFAVLLVALFVVSGVQPVSAQSKMAIRVLPESMIESELVNLGKISQVSGDSNRSDRLRNISLGYAPDIGMTREINRSQIKLAISAAGFSDAEFNLFTPDRILIRRLGQTVSESQIREAVEQSVLKQFAIDKISTRIVRLELPQDIQVPIGTLEIRPSFSGIRNMFERFPLAIEIRVDNKTVNRLAATLELVAFADIYVAAKDLPTNVNLDPTDVRIENRRLEKPITSYLRDPEKLRGAQLIKTLASGTALTSDVVVAGVVIQLGDPVQIEARSGKIKIIINGEARASGKVGDRISIKNLQSGVILQGLVVDKGKVSVTF